MVKRIMLVEDPPIKTCVGCRTCELACSFWHEKKFNPQKSRIRVVRGESAMSRPFICVQCPDPSCVAACPVDAIVQDIETGAVIIKEDLCTGCGVCIEKCPFDGISLHLDRNVAVKCDLCGSDPQCVRFCPQEVLHYAEPEEDSR